MKKLTLLLLCIAPFFAVAQAIPNGTFETWFFVGDTENPDFWVTDNTLFYQTVTKDFDSYEGDISMRVTAVPTGVGEYGVANTKFEIETIPEALNFYAKSEVEFGAVSVELIFYNEETVLYTEYWYSSENIPEYTLISIPLTQIEPIITDVRISVMAEVGDLIGGSAWISVDEMAFGEVLTVKEPTPLSFTVYPNPASETLTIQSAEGALGKIRISDIQGKLVFEANVANIETTINLQGFSPGAYTLSSDKLNSKASTFIVR